MNRLACVAKPLVFALVATSMLGACSKKKSSSSSGSSATFQIKSLQTTGASLQSFKPMDAVDDDLPASATAYSFAHVDGIKVTITQIRGRDTTSDNPKVTDTLNKDIELSGDPNQAIALNQSIDWTSGDFAGIDLYVKNQWSVKAYCKTNYNSTNHTYTAVYTTAAGVQTKTCTDGTSCDLTGYDYYAYSFLDPYYTEHASDVTIASHYLFTVPAGATPTVSFLYDGSYNVACWDGSAWSDSHSFGGFTNAGTSRTTYYPDGKAAFATGTLPMFAYVSTDASEATPTARTFLTSKTQSDLSSGVYDFNTVEVATLITKADGNLVLGNARNIHGFNADSIFDMDFEGFGTSSTGTGSDFYASGWYYKGGSDAPTFVRNRKFEGFVVPATASTAPFAVTVKNADGCGQTLTDFQGGNPSRGCLATSPMTHYWKEVVR